MDNIEHSGPLERPRSKFFWLYLTLAIFGGLLLIGYTALTIIAQKRALPFLTFQGQSVGLQTYAQLTKSVLKSDKQIKKTSITIDFEGKQETKSLEELGVSLQSAKTVDAIFDSGKTPSILKFPNLNYFKSTLNQNSEIPLEIKTSTLTENKINELFPNARLDPKNPSVTYENNSLVISPATEGTRPDLTDLKNKIQAKLSGKLNGNLVLQKTPIKSDYNENDVRLFLAEIENFTKKELSLKSNYKKIKLKNHELLGFVDVERTVLNQKFTLSDSAINDFLNTTVAKSFNVKGKKREISTVDNSVISEGREGQHLDSDKSAQNLKAAIETGSNVAELVVVSSEIEDVFVEPGYNLGKYPGRYVEVNLSEQMLYRIEGSQLVAKYKVSTGKWSMPTPEGEFSINNKVARAYSREYDLYMPYWMAFVGSKYGLHELPEWADGTKEGENHLGVPVSHGCVRLGRGAAQEVYDWVDIGTPVYIHR